MMKAQNKNRKHPTCSRCRFHGKKDIRVLQHQCPFRNCTCSSCFLIKRRSIIYRAQKNLDKHEENSNDADSPGGSGDGCSINSNFNEISNKSVTCSISRSSDSSSDATSYGTGSCIPEGSLSSGQQSWESVDQISMSQTHSHPQSAAVAAHTSHTTHSTHSTHASHSTHSTHATHSCTSSQSATTSSSTTNPIKSSDHYKISDFQSLCLTFPELTPSQLQTIFEQCGNDFQRTIDRILMSKWCNDSDAKPCFQFQNNNEWSSMSGSNPGDYATNVSSLARTGLPPSLVLDGMPPNFYHSSNADHCIDWRSNTCSTSNEDYSNPDYLNDYYYDQSFQACGVMSQQGNHQTYSNPNWNYDYTCTPYWYSNSQGSNASYDVNSSSQSIDDTGWHNGHNGQTMSGISSMSGISGMTGMGELALTPNILE